MSKGGTFNVPPVFFADLAKQISSTILRRAILLRLIRN